LSPSVLDLENYVPTYLTQSVNKWAHSSSRIYLAKFGVGINEWRTMTLLAIEPGISANRISAIMGVDKALVSRSIRQLEEQKLAARDMPSGRGSRPVSLTPAGRDLHDRILKLALQREKQLLDGFTSAEVQTLLLLLRRLTENAVNIQSNETRLLQSEKQNHSK
jgi:DNA-binding MarR family transcriptional regulator